MTAHQARRLEDWGFLVACLRHQGLLKPAPDAHHQHVLGEDHEAWKAKMLETQSDEVFIIAEADKPAKVAPTSSKTSDTKNKKPGGKGKKEAAVPVSTEGDGNDHPA